MKCCRQITFSRNGFCKLLQAGSDNKTTICTVTHAEWVSEGGVLVFHITADRFLRNMVRAIVGSLYEVGRGKWTVDDFKARMAKKTEGPWEQVPPHKAYT